MEQTGWLTLQGTQREFYEDSSVLYISIHRCSFRDIFFFMKNCSHNGQKKLYRATVFFEEWSINFFFFSSPDIILYSTSSGVQMLYHHTFILSYRHILTGTSMEASGQTCANRTLIRLEPKAELALTVTYHWTRFLWMLCWSIPHICHFLYATALFGV